MLKKVKKYLKFVVCCALMLSLMAPSYAALSASDGSAFVTKAEFDSALADFNARLTTFEAGINSKIDSQVTSYLDRNGIWSGKEQTLLTNYLWYRWDNDDWTKTTVPYTVTAKSNLHLPSTLTCGNVYELMHNRTVLIQNISKSGLMNVNFSVESPAVVFGITGDDARCVAIWICKPSNASNEQQQVSGTLVFSQCDFLADLSAADSASNVIIKISNNITQMQRAFYSFALENNAGTYANYFFVDKNKSLIVDYDVDFMIWMRDANIAQGVQNDTAKNNYGCPGQFVSFDKIEVY